MKNYPISLLCKIAGVSKSGYYKWWKNADKVKNEFDILLIAEMFFKSKQKAGFRTIKMRLLTDYGIIMNHKKIIRIMRKYGMTTKIRRANPYKLVARIKQDNIVCPNLVNRNFKKQEPNTVYSTDITYLKYSGTTAFLSVMLDVKTSEVISYSLSDNLQMGFVINTINSGIHKYPVDNLIIHSDRGVHYTNNVYQMLLRENNIQQSMSAPATPRDNAPIESFFGHLKDELDYKKCKSFDELSALVDDYMYNYNYTRKQWTKNKMTPMEYKKFLLVS